MTDFEKEIIIRSLYKLEELIDAAHIDKDHKEYGVKAARNLRYILEEVEEAKQ